MATGVISELELWTRSPAEYCIDDGVAYRLIRCGDTTIKLLSTIAVMQGDMLNAEGALAKWRVDEMARDPVVLSLPRR